MPSDMINAQAIPFPGGVVNNRSWSRADVKDVSRFCGAKHPLHLVLLRYNPDHPTRVDVIELSPSHNYMWIKQRVLFCNEYEIRYNTIWKWFNKSNSE